MAECCLQILDGAVVDAYLLGKLSPAECARFEEHYFCCAFCAEELEMTSLTTDLLACLMSPPVPPRAASTSPPHSA